MAGAGTLAATGQVIPYPEVLLRTAARLIADAQFNVAVVTAHMACEVATEQSFSAAFAAKGIPDLEEPVIDLLNGYNLANDRIRRLYSALTGDAIHQQPFWEAFKSSAKRRSRAVHAGGHASRSEAEESVKVAAQLVAHVASVRTGVLPPSV